MKIPSLHAQTHVMLPREQAHDVAGARGMGKVQIASHVQAHVIVVFSHAVACERVAD